jgi:pimeloyl-ACP methyl ester carboxylesterase
MKFFGGIILAGGILLAQASYADSVKCESVFNKKGALSSEQGLRSKGYLKISNGRQFWVDYTAPVNGKPTVVLVNGLTYSTKQWELFAKQLTAKGIGVVRYDMFGMGKTLLKNIPIWKMIPYERQAQDLKDILEHLEIPEPYNLVGLSYGGAIATEFAARFPKLSNKVILMAPFTRPIKEQDEWIKQQVKINRVLNPLNPATDVQLYDFYLKQIIYSTYPAAEPISLENYPYKLEAIFRMVQSVRHWPYEKAVNMLPQKTLHLMIAGNDQYIKREVMEDAWKSVDSKTRASRIIVGGAEHKIPEDVPNFSAAWVEMIINDHPLLKDGAWFWGDSKTGRVEHSDGEFRLPKDD